MPETGETGIILDNNSLKRFRNVKEGGLGFASVDFSRFALTRYKPMSGEREEGKDGEAERGRRGEMEERRDGEAERWRSGEMEERREEW